MPFDQFQKSFLFSIAKELDLESSLYEVPSSDRLSECLLLWNARLLLPPPKRDEMSLAIPKLWLCVHERFSPYLFQ
jgi:hypothetical protein